MPLQNRRERAYRLKTEAVYISQALPEAVLAENPATVEILYKRQIRLGDRVRFLYSVDGETGKHMVELKNSDGNLSA